MVSRVALLLSAILWLIMNILLWRAEYGHSASTGSAVPPFIIWKKMLTAPDPSSLSIFHHAKKVGFCHWTTSVGEQLSALREDTAGTPEGMVRRVTGYRVQLEGNLTVSNSPGRVRFESSLSLSTNQDWQELKVSVNHRPTSVEVRAEAAEQSLHLSWDTGATKTERRLRFSDLQSPAALVQNLGLLPGPFPIPDLLPANSGATGNSNEPRLDLARIALTWEGRNDEMRMGHSQVRVYRLRAHVLDRYELVIFVSRAGEILRVNLPDEIVLLNDQLAPPG